MEEIKLPILNKFKISGFLNTMLGSWVKIFVSAIVVFSIKAYAEDSAFFTFNIVMWKKLFNIGLIAVMPVILNYFNKNDPRYGKGKTLNLETKDEPAPKPPSP